MLQGERAAFKIAPELSLAQQGCRIQPPKGVSAEADLVIDLQLLHWYSKGEVKTVGDEGVIMRTLRGSDSWEHPRPPFEVSLACYTLSQMNCLFCVSKLQILQQ